VDLTMADDCCCTPLDGTVARTPDVDRVRRVAFDALRAGAAPRLSDIANRTGLDAHRVRDIVGDLVAGGIATTDGGIATTDGDLAGDPTVTGADGLTVRRTTHQLVIGGRLLYTWCAFDTVGIPAALDVDAVARTSCPTCNALVELVLPNGRPPPSPVVGWWPLATSGPVNESFCPTANLFCSRDHLDTWRAATRTGSGEPLPLTTLAERGRRTWALFLDPETPPSGAQSDGTIADLVVIGSGGAAMAAAIHAHRRGGRVIVVERATLGGTCVNVGCVPSKTLLAGAGIRNVAVTNPFDGVPTSAAGIDLAALVGQKDELVGRLRQAKYADVAAAYGFEIRLGNARFADETTLMVDGQPLPARAHLIATGAQSAIPDVSGITDVDYLTSTTAMELRHLPESLVVIGGGPVGMEQAQLFTHLGAQVTVIGRLAPRVEPELATRLHEVFVADGITVVDERASAVGPGGRGVVVVTESGRRLSAERVLVATGRSAVTAGLDLAAAGVKTDEHGFVTVDAEQRTSNPLVFAAGDVSGAPQFVYAAAAAGKAAAINALGGHDRVDYTAMPAVVFTRPRLASAGFTEADAVDEGHRCDCRFLDLADVPRALANRDSRGGVKLVADVDTGRVLGVHALAEGAGELMLAATYAIKAGFTVDDLADTWAPYLTMAESLRLVAQLFRDEMPTSCCA
jgi:mercuric reductase